ncbi:MAG: UDP-glucose 4-epimerase [Labilithrix sp.]|nr:UDP-glucose 4-epimerase [Labilithrix sp.]
MKRVLVTGGAGVVGSGLVDRLLAAGDEVIAIDDLSCGSYANLAHLKKHSRFVFVEHDVTTPFSAQVDRVFHLAVPSTRAACEPDAVQAALTCVLGTRHALEVAAQQGARLVLGTSTERWGEGVRCAERLAADCASSRGVDARIVRLPSSFGPRMPMHGDHIVPTLIRQAAAGERLAPHVRLDRRIRLAYVDDLVETLMRTMAAEQRTPAVVAGSSEIAVRELARLVAECVGRTEVDLAEDVDAGPASMPMSTRLTAADALPASLALGYEPEVDLAEGLRRTVAAFAARVQRSDRPSGVFARRPAAVAAVRRAAG